MQCYTVTVAVIKINTKMTERNSKLIQLTANFSYKQEFYVGLTDSFIKKMLGVASVSFLNILMLVVLFNKIVFRAYWPPL